MYVVGLCCAVGSVLCMQLDQVLWLNEAPPPPSTLISIVAAVRAPLHTFFQSHHLGFKLRSLRHSILRPQRRPPSVYILLGWGGLGGAWGWGFTAFPLSAFGVHRSTLVCTFWFLEVFQDT